MSIARFTCSERSTRGYVGHAVDAFEYFVAFLRRHARLFRRHLRGGQSGGGVVRRRFGRNALAAQPPAHRHSAAEDRECRDRQHDARDDRPQIIARRLQRAAALRAARLAGDRDDLIFLRELASARIGAFAAMFWHENVAHV